ncbi:MAG: aspartate kinase [Xanthomonadaceae bacterium]|nr:aspartate kinase [Xanthomonadaceae bacterium]
MSIWVQKYGGTSVGTPERIKQVAKRIAKTHESGKKLVVVVSAMGCTTDDLLKLAADISSKPEPREIDMLLTAGERISMALLSMALEDLGVHAISLTGSQSGIITDGSHRRAKIKKILGDRVRSSLDQGKVVIVAGFQGVSEAKEITTLGRGGSDTTAVALAAALGAEQCEIYTDVDGVYSTDPNLIASAKFYTNVSYDFMIEMSMRGAGVLHPRCVGLAKKYKVPVSVINSLKENREKKTVITENMEDVGIAGVTGDDEQVLVHIELARPTVFSALFDSMKDSNLQALSPIYFGKNVLFFTNQEGIPVLKKIVSKLQADGFIDSIKIQDEIVPVSIVSNTVAQGGEMVSKILSLLAENHIPVTVSMTSPLSLCVGVQRTKMKDALEILHAEINDRSR